MTDLKMERVSFIDPTRIKERLTGGPYFIEGWALSDDSRYFNKDKTRMWLASALWICWEEGLNYEGHRI